MVIHLPIIPHPSLQLIFMYLIRSEYTWRLHIFQSYVRGITSSSPYMECNQTNPCFHQLTLSTTSNSQRSCYLAENNITSISSPFPRTQTKQTLLSQTTIRSMDNWNAKQMLSIQFPLLFHAKRSSIPNRLKPNKRIQPNICFPTKTVWLNFLLCEHSPRRCHSSYCSENLSIYLCYILDRDHNTKPNNPSFWSFPFFPLHQQQMGKRAY